MFGRGNNSETSHFAEMQAVGTVMDPAALAAPDIETDHLLLVHSGSRGLGESVLRGIIDRQGHQGLDPASPEAADHLLQAVVAENDPPQHL